MSFEWQTEEERDWEETVAPETEVRRPSRGSWLWIGLLLVVAGVGLYFGWRTVQDRVQETTELVKDDVRSSHQLARQAAGQRDEELFVTLLSGRTASWTEAQKERLRRGLLYGNAAQVFYMEQLETNPNSEVMLNAELSEAVLEAEERFMLDAGDGITQTVVLTQTAVYRKGNHRWLLSPPTAEFWGEQQTVAGEMLTVAYPERDAALVERLVTDIDAVLQEMCLTFVTCPPRLTVRLQLDTDPDSVLLAADARSYLRGGNEITLPSPTLIGLPVDEASYQALFRGYASYIAALVLVETADYDCCEQARFQQAIVNLQLTELGLRPEPVDTADYIELVDNPPDLQRLRFWWNMEDPATIDETLGSGIAADNQFLEVEMYSFIRFLQNSGEAAPISLRDMQQTLSREVSFWRWIATITDYDSDDIGHVEMEWLDYARQRIREAQAAIRLPDELALPEQDIVAFCSRTTGYDVQRLDLQTGEWQTAMDLGFQFGVLAPMPGDNGYIVTAELPQQEESEPLIRSWMVRAGQEPVQVGGDGVDDQVIFPWGHTDPEGERFYGWRFNPQENELPTHVLIDPDSCSAEGCEYETVPGLPLWSPDHASKLYASWDESELYLQRPGEADFVELGVGQHPVWLDEETFAYMRWVPNQNAQTIIVGTLDNPEAQVLLSPEMLGGLVPGGTDRLGMSLRWMGKDPYDDDRLLFIAAPGGQGGSHLFELTRSDDSISWAESEVEVRWLEGIDAQPVDGWFYRAPELLHERWLVLFVGPPGNGADDFPVGGWMLYDLREEQLRLLSFSGGSDNFWGPPADLSADGQWFLRSIPGAMELVAPAYLVDDQRPFRYFIPHDFAQCQTAVWINGS
jgi:hypothetical protein